MGATRRSADDDRRDTLQRLDAAERSPVSVVTPPGTALVPTARARTLAERGGSLLERMIDWTTLQALRIVFRVVQWLIALRGRA